MSNSSLSTRQVVIRRFPVACRATSVVCAVLAVLGCTTTNTSNTARTAREQILISNAVDHALAKVDLSSFRGTTLWIEDKYLDCTDKGYLTGSLRHRAMMNGATLAAKPEDADIILEVRSGAVGTDSSSSFIGTPQMSLAGALTIPEVKVVSRLNQTALAKIGMVAYDAKTREVLGAGGVSASQSNDSNWFVLGVGPYQTGRVRDEIEATTQEPPLGSIRPMSTSVAFREPARRSGVEGEEPASRVQLTGGEEETP